MPPIIPIIMVVFTIGLLVMGLKANKEDDKVQERISALTERDRNKKPVTSRKKQLESSFNSRVLFPFTQMIFDRTQAFIPLSNKSWVKTKSMQAGYHKPNFPKIFLGFQLLCTVVVFALFFSFTALFGKVNGALGFIISATFGLAGYGFPMLWLLQQAQKRQEAIQKSLADFLDILVICVEAGLSLDVAIGKIINLKTVRTSSFLRDELIHYTRDVNFGRARKDALLDMADRTGVDDFNTIINAIIQSYEMGTSVAHTLRVQADSLRVKRLAKAEEKANKVPVKMVIPIYVFLFPAIIVCIGGPIIVVFIESVGSIFSKMNLGS
jgi:tight adherence protein C